MDKMLRRIGGDEFYSITQTVDGDCIAAGLSWSTDGDLSSNRGEQDYFICKFDPAGQLLWSKNYGGSVDDEAVAVECTSDNGIIVCGHSFSGDGDVDRHYGDEGSYDIWVIKLDSYGNLKK